MLKKAIYIGKNGYTQGSYIYFYIFITIMINSYLQC